MPKPWEKYAESFPQSGPWEKYAQSPSEAPADTSFMGEVKNQAKDLGQTILATPNHVISAVAGFPSDAANLLGSLSNKLSKAELEGLSKLTGKDFTQGKQALEKMGNVHFTGGSEDVSKAIAPVLPRHEPETMAGKIGALAVDSLLPFAGEIGAATKAEKAAMNIKDAIGSVPKSAETLAAAERQGVDLNVADVGGRGTKTTYQYLKDQPVAGNFLQKQAQKTVEQIKGARDRIVGVQGDKTEAGQAAQKGANTIIERSRSLGNRLYDRAFNLAGEVKVAPSESLTQLDKNIAELSATPNTNASKLKVLGEIRSDLVDAGGSAKSIDIKSFRDIRTAIRDRIFSEGLRGSDLERRANGVLDGVAQDIESSLSGEALSAFRKADGFWKQRAETIDKVLTTVLGKKGELSPEKAAANIDRLAGTTAGADVAKLRKLMNSLPPEDRSTITSSIISELGTSRAGVQNAAGEAFSPAQFLTEWNKISPKAKAVLFKPSQRAALNDLAEVAQATKETQALANTSGTARITNMGRLEGAGIVGMFVNPLATIGALAAYTGGQSAAARLMVNPKFVRWVADAAKIGGKPEKAFGVLANRHIAKLTDIARTEPAIANDIEKLLEGISGSYPKPVAASGDQADQKP